MFTIRERNCFAGQAEQLAHEYRKGLISDHEYGYKLSQLGNGIMFGAAQDMKPHMNLQAYYKRAKTDG